jgi:hypothetical protein
MRRVIVTEVYPAHRYWKFRVGYAILVLIAAFYYFVLLTDGSLNLFKPLGPMVRGMAFNSMLEHFLRGEFDVDPGTIAFEGVVRNGKTYTYFGVFPALLRLPLLPTGALAWLDVTGLYCALAATVALCFKLATVTLINNKLPKSRLQAIALVVLVLSLLLGGAQTQFLRGSIYQETIDWGGAINSAFVYCGVRGLIGKREFSPSLVAAMASLAGLALLTRPSIALGLYFATGLLVVALAWPPAGPLRDRLLLFVSGFASKRTVLGVTILLGFAVLSGMVNYERWGDPLEFSDPHTNGHLAEPWRLARLEAYGAFNLQRMWYGILYYFFPIWVIIRPDGQFLFSEFETRVLEGVEPPPSSFLLSDPLLLVLGGACLLGLPRLARERLSDRRAMVALMIGFLVPVVLMLTFCNMAFRYRMEFYPYFEFTAFLGFYAICISPGRFSALSRSKLSAMLTASGVFGIVCSHVLLILYKISPYQVSAADGWLGVYFIQLKLVYPSIAQRLHFLTTFMNSG